MASESEERDEHQRWMALALQQAYQALDYEEVPVGCVIVDERTQTVIAQAFNRTNIEKNVSRRHSTALTHSCYTVTAHPTGTPTNTAQPLSHDCSVLPTRGSLVNQATRHCEFVCIDDILLHSDGKYGQRG